MEPDGPSSYPMGPPLYLSKPDSSSACNTGRILGLSQRVSVWAKWNNPGKVSGSQNRTIRWHHFTPSDRQRSKKHWHYQGLARMGVTRTFLGAHITAITLEIPLAKSSKVKVSMSSVLPRKQVQESSSQHCLQWDLHIYQYMMLISKGYYNTDSQRRPAVQHQLTDWHQTLKEALYKNNFTSFFSP